ncbi:MAG: DUF4390 domain-containing protein [Gammaproteobacteria bacterium]|nr:DUF4390 domain-containing protein [Gammaproteobacteria bacterium]
MLARSISKHGTVRYLLIIALCLLPVAFCFAQDEYFTILRAKTRLADKLYLLEAAISYQLSKDTIEALENGVALTLVLDIKVTRKRWYVWNQNIAAIQQRYRLKYHALSRQYLVKHLNTGIQKAYWQLNSALAALGKLNDFPLLDRHLLTSGKDYGVYLKAYLDIEALPAPLRPMAYFSSEWRLTSKPYKCSLTP